MNARACLSALAVLLSACAKSGTGSGMMQSTPSSTTATATLHDASGRQVGSAMLADTYAGVLLSGTVSGIGAGTHGIHVHETGRCEAPFTTAGGHFNPAKRKHGFKNPEGSHAGDMPNISAPPSGELKFELLLPSATLTSSNRLLDDDGAAIVIHGAADDYATDPSGGSGARIVCGVIRAR